MYTWFKNTLPATPYSKGSKTIYDWEFLESSRLNQLPSMIYFKNMDWCSLRYESWSDRHICRRINVCYLTRYTFVLIEHDCVLTGLPLWYMPVTVMSLCNRLWSINTLDHLNDLNGVDSNIYLPNNPQTNYVVCIDFVIIFNGNTITIVVNTSFFFVCRAYESNNSVCLVYISESNCTLLQMYSL